MSATSIHRKQLDSACYTLLTWASDCLLQNAFSITTTYMAITLGFKIPLLMFSGFSAFTFVALFLVMPETRYNRKGHELLPKVLKKEYKAFRDSIMSKIGSDFAPYTLSRQLAILSWPEKGNKDHSILDFVKRVAMYGLSPILWWNALLNTVISGYVNDRYKQL